MDNMSRLQNQNNKKIFYNLQDSLCIQKIILQHFQLN